jgi:hypothetical protein
MSKNNQIKSSDRRLVYEKNELEYENDGCDTNRSPDKQNNKLLNDIMNLGEK